MTRSMKTLHEANARQLHLLLAWEKCGELIETLSEGGAPTAEIVNLLLWADELITAQISQAGETETRALRRRKEVAE